MTATLRLVYHTAKVRLGFLIMACALAGIAVSPGHQLSAWQIAILGIATLVASSAAGAFNQLYERDLDKRMRRTHTRPFVTGRFKADAAWHGGIIAATLTRRISPLRGRRMDSRRCTSSSARSPTASSTRSG